MPDAAELRTHFPTGALALAVGLLASAPGGAEPAPVLDAVRPALADTASDSIRAFVAVHVLPMDGDTALADHTVLVEGETIVQVAPSGEVALPGSTEILARGPGNWVVPGLTDAHVHLDHDPGSWIDLLLAAGVTTVFNLRGDTADLELRRRIREGRIAGPTIYSAGGYLDELEIESAAAADSVVERQAREGFDLVKIHGPMPEQALGWVVEAAQRHGLPVVGHVPRNLGLATALDAGMDMISHAEEVAYGGFPELESGRLTEVGRRMVQHGVWLTPNLAGFAGLVRQWGDSGAAAERLERPEAAYLNRKIRSFWTEGNPYVHRPAGPEVRERLAEQLRFQERLVRTFHEAGVPMLVGTDAPFPTMYPGFSLHEELAALRAVGLSATDALAAATTRPGEFVRTRVDADELFGRVRPGYRADLLLLHADPREDSATLARPAGVMARGRWLDRAGLDRRLAAAAEAATSMSGGVALADCVLSALTGRYVSQAPPFDVRAVVSAEGGLVVEDARNPDTRPRYRLIPVDARTFEVRGGPFPLFAVFVEEGDVMELRRGGPDGPVFARLDRRGTGVGDS